MLERVPLLDKHLDDYADVVEPGTLERIRELAAPLQGARVLHVNATAYGGGVAELLATHVALLRDLGIEAEWQVIHGSDEFFAVTKTVHNALQGADVEWTQQMERVYLERVLDNALQLEGDWDYRRHPRPATRGDARVRARRAASRPRARSGSGAATSTSPTRTVRCSSSSGRSSSSTTRRCGRCRSSFPTRCTWSASCSRRRASIRCR